MLSSTFKLEHSPGGSDFLAAFANEMHLCAAFLRVKKREMSKSAEIEVSIQFTINPLEKIEVETPGYSLDVVIRAGEGIHALDQIDPKNEHRSFAQYLSNMLQQTCGIVRFKVPNCRSRKEAHTGQRENRFW